MALRPSLPSLATALAALAGAAAAGGGAAGQEGATATPGPARGAGPARTALHASPAGTSPAADFEDFVGARACAACHAAEYGAWSESTHGRAGGPPGEVGVLPGFDGTPIVFADAVVVPSVDEGGGYRFTVRRPGRPDEIFPVEGVVGGGHMVGGGTQGFVSRFPDGTVRFLPFDWSRGAGTWFCNTTSIEGWWSPGASNAALRPDVGWTPITPRTRLTDCGDWPPVRILGTDARFANCQGCHGSQIQVSFEDGAYDTRIRSLAINCESCHGPGREHVERAREGRLPDGTAMGDLAALDKDASLEVCFACHALKRSLAPGWLPGEPLADHYSLGAVQIGDRPYLPDGRVRTFGYQANHRASACYLDGPMTCTSCHEPHGQGYRDAFGQPLVGRLDDGQCTACHASKVAEGRAHTGHPPGSDGASCVGCHMPFRQQPELGAAVPYARSDHTISIPRPGLDESLGLTSACALCHGDTPLPALMDTAAAWYGRVRPHAPAVAALVRAEAGELPPDRVGAAAELLAPGPPHPMARMAALDRFAADHLTPDMPALEDEVVSRLVALAGAGDVDVAALAVALLDLARGGEPGVAALLAERRTAAGAEARRLRLRWAAALGLLGERYGRRGDAEAAARAREKALAVLPDDPALLLDLAAARAATGRVDEAAALYARVAAGAPGDLAAVALVNRGLLLERAGRPDEAEADYRRAVEIHPGEALAHLNLGNAHLRRDEVAEAREAYRAAARAAPSLGAAHYYLGVTSLLLDDPGEGVPALWNALELDPDNPEIRSLLRRLGVAR